MPKKHPFLKKYLSKKITLFFLLAVVLLTTAFLFAKKNGYLSPIFSPATIAELEVRRIAKDETLCPMIMKCSDDGICAETYSCGVGGIKGVDPNSGCYYQQVQCFKAPCDPILVCPPKPTCVPRPSCEPGDPPPGVESKDGKIYCALLGMLPQGQRYCDDTPQPSPGRYCSEVAGSCVDKNGTCVTYIDGCQQSEVCVKPLKSCVGKKPAPSPVKSSPSPVPFCRSTIEHISFNNPCENNGFSNISYKCNGVSNTMRLEQDQCRQASDAFQEIVQNCCLGRP